MLVAGLSIFYACEKNDELIDQSADIKSAKSITNPMFAGLDTIAFSVENNRLVFESEEEYQKCMDFLITINVEDYNLFGKEIGFNSLLSTSIATSKDCPIEDEIFATLLNPEMQIIIDHYLFTLNHEKEKVDALFIGEDYDLKNVKSTVQEFNYDDDVFASLNREKLKSIATDYCGQENSLHSLPNGIETYVDYNKYGIYNSLVSKIENAGFGQRLYLKHETIDGPPVGIVPPGISKHCFYKRVGKQNNIVYSHGFDYEIKLKKTLWQNYRRLTGFRIDMYYSWKFTSSGTIYHDTNMIECHQY